MEKSRGSGDGEGRFQFWFFLSRLWDLTQSSLGLSFPICKAAIKISIQRAVVGFLPGDVKTSVWHDVWHIPFSQEMLASPSQPPPQAPLSSRNPFRPQPPLEDHSYHGNSGSPVSGSVHPTLSLSMPASSRAQLLLLQRTHSHRETLRG